MTDSTTQPRTLFLRIAGHAAMRCIEALMLAWVVWFVVDVILSAGGHMGAHAVWFYLVQNGIWEFWEHLVLISDTAVRAGAWNLVLGCLCIVCFLRYRRPLAGVLEG
jgi:hypothetical protein